MINLDTYSLYEIIVQEYCSDNRGRDDTPQKIQDDREDAQLLAELIIRRVNAAAEPPRPQYNCSCGNPFPQYR